MAVFDVTLRVDNSRLFDALHEMGSDFAPLGERIVSTLLTPQNISVREAIGMGVYGVEVSKIEEVTTKEAKRDD